ncbi:MAG: hypothetical protein BWY95_02538 [Bacteroidetes bacterium ADurb.BinA104]|nr:MAG: hypothetical protein BWY95_02538 [Bacteroidetes bacterium ADurb.BinA104]
MDLIKIYNYIWGCDILDDQFIDFNVSWDIYSKCSTLTSLDICYDHII